MIISVKVSGSFDKTEKYLTKLQEAKYFEIMEKYGSRGVGLLSVSTPVDQGTTARSWTYEVRRSSGHFTIVWRNTHITNGFPVAVMIQYGHGTRNGGYVTGRDYINPAIKPLFNEMISELEREVKKL